MLGKKRRQRRSKKDILAAETKASILAVSLILCGALVMVSFTGQGAFLRTIYAFLQQTFGFITIFIPFLFIAAGLTFFKSEAIWGKAHFFWGALVAVFGLLVLGHAGTLGGNLFLNLSHLISGVGVSILSLAVIIIGLVIMFQISWREVVERWTMFCLERQARRLELESQEPASDKTDSAPVDFVDNGEMDIPHIKTNTAMLDNFGEHSPPSRDEMETVDPLHEEIEQRAQETGLKKIQLNSPAPLDVEPSSLEEEPLDQSHLVWHYPTLDLFSDTAAGEADRGDIRANAQKIQDTLDSFGIRAKVAEVNRGPSVTQYALEIAMGTKVSKITSLSNNLALALAAPNGQIRIEAPIAGKSLVGIEVPNYKAAFVTLKHMLAQKAMEDAASKLTIALGIDVSNNPIFADIAKMPHVLIAGATGSGKSVGINGLLCSILFRASPHEVRLILVDPKRVEMTPYQDIPHLLTPVIYDVPKIISALKWLTVEMDGRYERLAEAGVRNISAYNEKMGFSAMYQIVLVIDEFADIMMFAPSEVEECIVRLTQKARAVGIHCVLATQRPSVNVVTGLIKGNIPTRVAYNVASITDSRVILDVGGAEKLLGNGDMLYMAPDKPKAVRIQGTYVSDDDVNRLTGFLRAQEFRPEYQDEITTKYKVAGKGAKGGDKGEAAEDDGERDPLFADAARVFSNQEMASSSAIQRRLSVGYARAARILDQLEHAGLVGQANGSKPREIHHEAIMQFLSSQT